MDTKTLTPEQLNLFAETLMAGSSPTIANTDGPVTGTAFTFTPSYTPPAPCPSCGRCPTCGRGGHYAQPSPYWQYPYYPTYPNPWTTYTVPATVGSAGNFPNSLAGIAYPKSDTQC